LVTPEGRTIEIHFFVKFLFFLLDFLFLFGERGREVKSIALGTATALTDKI